MKIFVSYSRRDTDFAEELDDYFKNSDHDVFTDVDDIQIGDVWSNEIENNISNCDLFVVIITHAALRSSEVEIEVLQAQRENKKIIPCFHKNVSENEIKWNLSKIHGIEFKDKYELARDLYSKITKVEKSKSKSSTAVISTTMNAGSMLDEGDVYFDKGEYNKALDYYDKAIEIDPTNSDAWNNKGLSLDSLGKYEEAIECYDRAIEIDPNDAAIWYNKAESLKELRKYNEAIASYDRAIEIDPNQFHAFTGKGIALYHLGKYNEAIQAFDRAIEINPDYFAFTGKGLALYELRKYNEAIASYDRAIEIDPNQFHAFTGKGFALYELRKYNEAIASYDRAIEIDPNHAGAWNGKGLALKATGNEKEADKFFKKVKQSGYNV